MDAIFKLGRFLFAIPMIIFGIFHFMGANDMAEWVPIPGGVFWIYFTGLALIAAGVSIIIRKKDRLACFLLAVMLLIFAFALHFPGTLDGDQNSTTAFLKDIALAGGALAYGSMAARD